MILHGVLPVVREPSTCSGARAGSKSRRSSTAAEVATSKRSFEPHMICLYLESYLFFQWMFTSSKGGKQLWQAASTVQSVHVFLVTLGSGFYLMLSFMIPSAPAQAAPSGFAPNHLAEELRFLLAIGYRLCIGYIGYRWDMFVFVHD